MSTKGCWGGLFLRIWAFGAFGKFSRKWRFSLDWVPLESRGNLVTGCLNNFYPGGVRKKVGLELVKKEQPSYKLEEGKVWTIL